MIWKWGRHFDVVRLNLQLKCLQQAHLQNDQTNSITKQGLALPCALNTFFSHISQCVIICLRISVLKPGTTATLSGFTTLSNRFRQQSHAISEWAVKEANHLLTQRCIQPYIDKFHAQQLPQFWKQLLDLISSMSNLRHTDLYCANLNVPLPRSLSFLLLFAFLLVEAHVGLWAPRRQQWLVELVQVSCVTLVHRLWLDGWQEVIRVMWSHCIREEGRKAGCHRAKCMSMVTICQARRVPIVAVLTRNQVAHQGLQGHVALRTKAFYRRTGLLLSPTSTEHKRQISQTPFSPANVNMCELSSNTKLSPAFTRVTLQ